MKIHYIASFNLLIMLAYNELSACEYTPMQNRKCLCYTLTSEAEEKTQIDIISYNVTPEGIVTVEALLNNSKSTPLKIRKCDIGNSALFSYSLIPIKNEGIEIVSPPLSYADLTPTYIRPYSSEKIRLVFFWFKPKKENMK